MSSHLSNPFLSLVSVYPHIWLQLQLLQESCHIQKLSDDNHCRMCEYEFRESVVEYKPKAQRPDQQICLMEQGQPAPWRCGAGQKDMDNANDALHKPLDKLQSSLRNRFQLPTAQKRVKNVVSTYIHIIWYSQCMSWLQSFGLDLGPFGTFLS